MAGSEGAAPLTASSMALLKFCGQCGVRSGGKLAVLVLAWRSKRMKSKQLPFVIEFSVRGLS